MTGHPRSEQRAYAVASVRERYTALGTAIALIALTAIALPFGARFAGESDSLLPVVNAMSLVAMIVSATILRNQYRSSRFVPYAFLGIAFGFTALLLVPYTLSFPRAFSANGFGYGLQVEAWLWVIWHAGFILMLGAYVWSQSFFTRKDLAEEDAARYVRTYILWVSIAATVVVSSIFFWHASLPVLITPAGFAPLFHLLVEQLLLASCGVVLATLVVRTYLLHTTHLWLGVVLMAVGIDTYVSGEIVTAHFTVAWYAGLLQNLVWQGLFLAVQLRHANEQYAADASDKRSLIEATLRDALTGLYNRRGFDTRLETAIVESHLGRVPLALLELDLDHFKAYNDHYGHLAGDEALRAIGAAIAPIANRPTDACCRVGGEEFAVILSMTDVRGASTVAERVRAAVMRLNIAHAPAAPQPFMTVSIGVAVVDGNQTIVPTELYARADRALYAAKHLGRNCVAVYNDPREIVSREIVSRESGSRDAGLRAV